MSHVNFSIPSDEVLAPGHLGCAGCGASLAMRFALKALGRRTVLVVPACCWSVIDGPAPYSAAGVPVMHTPFASAAAIRGTRVVHVLAPCPPGWKIAPEHTIRIARLAVAARVFPLLEVRDGQTWRLTLVPEKADLETYLRAQGRFRALLDDPAALERARAAVEDRWQRILTRLTE